MGGIGSTPYKRLQFSPAWHTQTPEDLFGCSKGSARTDKLIEASVQSAAFEDE
jgi:hypothetical protein